MATMGGGVLLVGVRPDGQIVGWTQGEGEIERLTQQILANSTSNPWDSYGGQAGVEIPGGSWPSDLASGRIRRTGRSDRIDRPYAHARDRHQWR